MYISPVLPNPNSNILEITKSRLTIGWDDTGIMQYTNDLKNIYFRLFEDCVGSVFSNYVAYYSPLYQAHRE